MPRNLPTAMNRIKRLLLALPLLLVLSACGSGGGSDSPSGSSTATGTTLEDTAVDLIPVVDDPNAGLDPTYGFAIVTPPVNGTASIGIVSGARILHYVPNPDFAGTDTFVFSASQGGSITLFGNAVVTVTPVNDAPVAPAQAATAVEDAVITLTPTIVDPDDTTFTFTVASPPSNGSVAINGQSLVFTPALNFFGSTSFTYRATDSGGLSADAAVTLTYTPVNDAPTGAVALIQTAEDTPGQTVPVVTDPDLGDSHTITLSGQPANGVASVVAGELHYVPNANFNGSDSFTFQVTDGDGLSLASPATATVQVTPVNDAPLSATLLLIVPEDGAGTATPVITEVDSGDSHTLSVVTQPANGIATVVGNQFRYVPTSNINGSDSFTFQVTDAGGLSLATPATAAVTITPTNDPPTAQSAVATTAEDTPVVITPTVIDIDVADTITLSVSTPPSNGNVTVSGGDLTYTPQLNFNGNDQFVYAATDSGGLTSNATVSVTITPVNDAPTATTVTVLTLQGVAATVTPSTSDPDSGDSHTYTLLTQPTAGTVVSNTTTLTFTPGTGQTGSDSFTFRATDSGGLTVDGTGTIIIGNVNDAPTSAVAVLVTNEDTPIAVTPTVVDPDSPTPGDSHTFSIVTPASNGTASVVGGQLRYTPNLNSNGSDSFTFQATDAGGLSLATPATATVTVIAVNDPPVADPLSITTVEDTPITVTPTVTDPDAGDSFSLQLPTQPSNGTATVNGLTLTYTPVTQFFGVDSFTYQATDSTGLTHTATVTVTVTQINDPPSSATATLVTAEDTPVSVTPTVVDPDVGNTFTFSIVTQPTKGTANVVNGQLRYLPDPNTNGNDSFTFQVTDGGGLMLATPATATVQVSPVNDAPTAATVTLTTTEDSPVLATPVVTDPDVGDLHTFVIVSQPANGTASVVGGQLRYAPNANINGNDSFTYRAIDSGGLPLFTPATAPVSITPVNDPPLVADIAATTLENGTGVDLLPTVTDPDIATNGDTHTFALNGPVTNGTVAPIAGGLHFTPDQFFNGTVVFGFTTTDSGGAVASGTATITVTNTNTGPTLDDLQTSTLKNVTKTDIAPVINDPDTGDVHTYTLITQPAHGTATVNNALLLISYVPDLDYFGVDSFTVQVSDAATAVSNIATVTIHIIETKPTGPKPRDLVIADINGNGFNDIITANELGDTIGEVMTVFAGNGTGIYTSGTAIPPTNPGLLLLGAVAVRAADLNNDTLADLVVVYQDNDSIAVALGSTGTVFARAAIPIDLLSSPHGVALADLDGDSLVDAAVTQPLNDTTILLKGDGLGNFDSATPLNRLASGASTTPWNIASGDLDGDGMTDLTVAPLQFNANDLDRLQGLLNAGSGNFTPANGLPDTAQVQPDVHVAMADLNGDGRADAVRTYASQNRVEVLLADAGGGLTTAVSYAVGKRPTGVALGDVTGDGINDIVTADLDDNAVTILPGNEDAGNPGVGDGTFGNKFRLVTPPAPAGVAIGDLDLTGAADIVTVHPATSLMGILLR